MENVFILLLGYPGVGKYTVAQELEKHIPNCKLIDNHYINNPLFNLVGDEVLRDDIPEGIRDNVAKFRNIIIDTIRDFSPKHFNFIMTLFCIDDEHDRFSYQRREDLAAHRGDIFLPVLLSCKGDAYKQRAINADRTKRKKLVKWDILEKINKKGLYIPDHPNLLQIDTTHLSPEQTADIIFKKAKELSSERGGI